MATILLAEDEAVLRQHFKKKLSDVWPEAEIVAECDDGLSAVEAFEETQPQVCFLDIQMPEMTGLEVAREIAGRAHVVFVTAYDQYAIEAFDKGAVDYLVKPINEERLTRTVERLKERISAVPSNAPTDLTRRRAAAPLNICAGLRPAKGKR
jgi:DNA-binding LytR/AlgR family response regulator